MLVCETDRTDPVIAQALRISMEEEKARQERARLEAERERSGVAAPGGENGETATQAPPATTEMEVFFVLHVQICANMEASGVCTA
jgi:hypothetical protein